MYRYKEQLDAYFQSHREEFLQDLAELISINSSGSEALPDMPFGKGPALALEKALQIAEKYGLYTENWENYVGIVQIEKGDVRTLDIMVHLDVVPAGDGWSITEPFSMFEKDGYLYGRGTADDKGPALAAIYALRAVKELGLPMREPVRIMLGCDEESGSRDLDYYFSRTSAAPMSISPDGEYPVINIEKGLFYGKLSADYPQTSCISKVISFHSGSKGNVIPATAYAEIQGIDIGTIESAISAVSGKTGAQFTYSCFSKDLIKVTAQGKSGHASNPEDANNAATAMLNLIYELPIKFSEGYEKLCSLHTLFPHGDVHGSSAGIYIEDELSGKITVSLDILDYTETHLDAVFDSRTPISADEQQLSAIEKKALGKGFSFSKQISSYHHVPEEERLVQSLLNIYEMYTGKREKPIAIGGGTYVHNIKNGVAFGCAVKGIDNRMHGPNEFADIEILLMSGKMLASAAIDLCNGDR